MTSTPTILTTPDALTFLADRGDARLRLDLAIVRRLSQVPRLSRSKVQRWIDDGLVLVNGQPARRASSPIAAGDRIAIHAPEALAPRIPPGPESLPLDILYEDDAFLVLNKPAGIVVHPTYKHASGTLLNGLLGYLQGTDDADAEVDAPADPLTEGRRAAEEQPRLVHRLDKDTSGVLLVSRNHAVHVALQRALAGPQSRKEYLAVVKGTPRPSRGTIHLALGTDPSDRRRVMAREDGRDSETRYAVLARGGGLSLVRCELVTGRTHQIRVHLAASGWPIVGDAVYGVPSELLDRQALHAWRLTFPHPVTGERMQFTAPLPRDMRTLIEANGLGFATGTGTSVTQ